MKICKLLALWLCIGSPACAADSANVYVVLWFDTEDYILPASDDAALRVAELLSREQVRATFKVVGEKARTLERRGRADVIAALKKHEIGYHSNFHSVHPSPAEYLANMGWDDGVAEFDRRERAGRDDVQRIFGVAPTCYGQPGNSWAPQTHAVMKKWGMQVYLDSGLHVGIEGRPIYYGGVLNLYKLTHTMRVNLDGKDVKGAEDRFLAARDKLKAEGGGVISIYYHPCEFVHKEFWDVVNFRNGANPPRDQWKLPPAKSVEESKVAYQVFEEYVRFMRRFPEVRFITASDAAKLYADRARGRKFSPDDLKAVAAAVQENVTFQQHENYALTASEVFALLNEYVAARAAGQKPETIELSTTPYGPTTPVPPLTTSIRIDWSQFARTAADLAGHIRAHERIPSSVWLGSLPVPPEAYFAPLAQVTMDLVDNKPAPEVIEIKPAKFTAAAHVADDDPKIWRWIIFPPGFRAPELMELAKRQAWTLKPALLRR